MSTQALYNKWRGQTFGDILGQEHITTTLQNQIRAGRVGHAYLFTGLRGTGKTSTARIFAKAVNCIGKTDRPPCNQCHICRSITEGRSLDLIEIDSASNRGIDEIRDLRDKVAFSPSECRFKVYVIDEVHMLTNEAFNALLKTLEEPPAHVIFILCTTEPHRLPDTVLSRCQRFDFRRGATSVLMRNLQNIAAHEEIAIAPEALEFIARRATGSFRDAVSLLDQLAAYGAREITLAQVQNILGSVSVSVVAQLVLSLVKGDVPGGLRAINEAIDNGAEPHQLLTEVLDYLRAVLLLKVGGEDSLSGWSAESLADIRHSLAGEPVAVEMLVRALKLFNEAGQGLRTAARPQLPLELAFVEAALRLDSASTSMGDVSETAGTTSKCEAGANTRAARNESMSDSALPVEEPPALRHTPTAIPSEASGMPASVGMSADRVTVPRGNASQPMAAGDSATVLAEQALASYTPRPIGNRDDIPAAAQSSVPPVDTALSAPQATSGEPATGAAQKLTLEWVRGNWRQALVRLRPISPQVQALLNSAAPLAVQGDVITIGCPFSFHRDKLSEDKNRDLVEQVLAQVLGTPCHIQCVVAAEQRDIPSETTLRRPAADMFSGGDARESVKQQLLNHPAVKELEKHGGKVSKVSLNGEEEDKGGS